MSSLADRSRWNSGRVAAPGERVVVRKYLAGDDTSHLLTDVTGIVVQLDPILRIRRSDGTVTDIEHSEVQVLKVLPARTVRNRDIRALNAATALGWPGTYCEVVDGWLCRSGDHFSYRRDAATPIFPWARFSELEGVRRWYLQRSLVPRIEVVERLVGNPRSAGVSINPDQGGEEMLVLSGRSSDIAGSADTVVTDKPRPRHTLTHNSTPADDWIDLYHGTHGRDPAEVRPVLCAAAQLDGELAHADTPSPLVTFVRIDIAGALAATGRGVLTAGTDEVRRIAVSCIETAPQFRRMGMGSRVTAELARWGLSNGAEVTHLHAYAHNAAGKALYEANGFTEHHRVWHGELVSESG